MIKESSNRRDFLLNTTKVIGAGLAIATVPQVFISCESEELVTVMNTNVTTFYVLDLTSHPELLVAGAIKKIKIEGKNNDNPLVITHHKNGSFSVVDSICPHMNCAVDLPSDTDSTLVCQCHPNNYSTVDGKYVGGPFQGYNLKQYTVGKFDEAKKTLEIKI